MSHAETAPTSPLPRRRIDLVDLARGLALLAMFVYHFAYDLSHFDLIATEVPSHPGWSAFARLIAGSFLTIVGFSLVLATRRGVNLPAYFRRLAVVAGAAALVTIATWFAMPESFIYFGILHNIALASVLALPFLRLPAAALLLFSALFFALPLLPPPQILDRPWLLWLGFAHVSGATADFVPIVPWFGCVLAGMALGKLALARQGSWSHWQAHSLPARVIAWGGRHSLSVYLLHQPIFIGVLLIVMRLAVGPEQEARPFLISCLRSCVSAETSLQMCEKACNCAIDGLKRDGLWRKVLSNTLTREESARTGSIAGACFRAP
ncbi:heparan-alpha-glucosaminide N-acetyltransferase [Bosea sp. 2KB_26]|uniref:heparan-alpha-glucosaminide N-acetyltransferase n=1 Tax=Bosea sp. 2KB_26 TaxID=3237475 RepID=UPI003F8DDBB0